MSAEQARLIELEKKVAVLEAKIELIAAARKEQQDKARSLARQ